MDVRLAASTLGIKPSMLKLAIRQGVLPAPDIPAVAGFAVSGFTSKWIEAARPVIATAAFDQLRYKPG